MPPKEDPMISALKCFLCKDYIYHAVTMTDCGHSFCRTCASSKALARRTCPQCKKSVNKKQPFHPNPSLSRLIYKVVPDLLGNNLKNEEIKTERFTSIFLKSTPLFRNYYVKPDTTIPLNMHLFDALSVIRGEDMTANSEVKPFFFRGKAAMPVSVIRSVLNGRGPQSDYTYLTQIVEPSTLQVLSDSMTLQDIVSIRGWDRSGPIDLYYTYVNLPSAMPPVLQPEHPVDEPRPKLELPSFNPKIECEPDLTISLSASAFSKPGMNNTRIIKRRVPRKNDAGGSRKRNMKAIKLETDSFEESFDVGFTNDNGPSSSGVSKPPTTSKNAEPPRLSAPVVTKDQQMPPLLQLPTMQLPVSAAPLLTLPPSTLPQSLKRPLTTLKTPASTRKPKNVAIAPNGQQVAPVPSSSKLIIVPKPPAMNISTATAVHPRLSLDSAKPVTLARKPRKAGPPVTLVTSPVSIAPAPVKTNNSILPDFIPILKSYDKPTSSAGLPVSTAWASTASSAKVASPPTFLKPFNGVPPNLHNELTTTTWAISSKKSIASTTTNETSPAVANPITAASSLLAFETASTVVSSAPTSVSSTTSSDIPASTSITPEVSSQASSTATTPSVVSSTPTSESLTTIDVAPVAKSGTPPADDSPMVSSETKTPSPTATPSESVPSSTTEAASSTTTTTEVSSPKPTAGSSNGHVLPGFRALAPLTRSNSIPAVLSPKTPTSRSSSVLPGFFALPPSSPLTSTCPSTPTSNIEPLESLVMKLKSQSLARSTPPLLPKSIVSTATSNNNGLNLTKILPGVKSASSKDQAESSSSSNSNSEASRSSEPRSTPSVTTPVSTFAGFSFRPITSVASAPPLMTTPPVSASPAKSPSSSALFEMAKAMGRVNNNNSPDVMAAIESCTSLTVSDDELRTKIVPLLPLEAQQYFSKFSSPAAALAALQASKKANKGTTGQSRDTTESMDISDAAKQESANNRESDKPGPSKTPAPAIISAPRSIQHGPVPIQKRMFPEHAYRLLPHRSIMRFRGPTQQIRRRIFSNNGIRNFSGGSRGSFTRSRNHLTMIKPKSRYPPLLPRVLNSSVQPSASSSFSIGPEPSSSSAGSSVSNPGSTPSISATSSKPATTVSSAPKPKPALPKIAPRTAEPVSDGTAFPLSVLFKPL